MTPSMLTLIVVCSTLLSSTMSLSQELKSNFARDPGQPIDQQYTDRIHKYTTDPSFISPLVDYLPASKTVPTVSPIKSRPLARSSKEMESGVWPGVAMTSRVRPPRSKRSPS